MPSGPTLLLIDDDLRLARMVSEYLQNNGFRVIHRLDALSGLQTLQKLTPATVPPVPSVPSMSLTKAQKATVAKTSNSAESIALVLLDWMLPDIDGLEVCRRIRALPQQFSATPILMLTAKGDPIDKVLGLEVGADDYLAKPFEPRELLARIRAILRRSQGLLTQNLPASTTTDDHALGSIAASAAVLGGNTLGQNRAPSAANLKEAPNALVFGSLVIDRDARQVCVDGTLCVLTSHQFDLLLALAERPGKVLSREQLMDAVRGRDLEPFDRSIDVHIGRIRSSIEADPKTPKRIVTVRGVGYIFSRQQD